jgi:transcriptional pleiotropic regulator of transition state genes
MLAVRIDRYGRLLIPKEVRDRLGLTPWTTLELALRGDEIVLSPRNLDLEGRVEELSRFLEREAPRAFVNPITPGDSKWMSRDYSLRKIGLSRE